MFQANWIVRLSLEYAEGKRLHSIPWYLAVLISVLQRDLRAMFVSDI